MHVSDIALECARECLRAAADIPDRIQSRRLASIGQRLIDALIEDAAICTVPPASLVPDALACPNPALKRRSR
jgi:hypothetical protein